MQEQCGREEASDVHLQVCLNAGCRSKAEGRRQALCTCKYVLTLDAGAVREGGGKHRAPELGLFRGKQEQPGREDGSYRHLQAAYKAGCRCNVDG